MAKIVISYRRQDTGQIVASIYNYIAQAFGPDSVFVDTKNIPDGARFTSVIEGNIRDARVMLVVIGRNWLGVSDDGRRRIDEPDDVVRAEVRLGLELARQGRLTLIPVLVDDAAMPASQQLPADLSELPWRNAAQLHSSLTYLPDDMNRLLGDLSPAGIPRRVSGRIDAPHDYYAALVAAQAAPAAPAPPAPPAPPARPETYRAFGQPAPAPSGGGPASAGGGTGPSRARPAPAPVRPSPAKTPTPGWKGALELLLALIFGLPGLIRGLLILGVIVAVVVAVVNLNNGLNEHSSCQDFEQASADAQTRVIQQMMSAHHDTESIQTTRFSLTLYCNVEGPSAPIDGIYGG